MYARAARSYRTVHLESASPVQVLDDALARVLRDLADARRHIVARDVPAKAEALGHALQLVSALQAALDHGPAPEMCANLHRLYEFVKDRLLQAGAALDPAPLTEAERIITTLRTAFADAQQGVAP